MARSLACAGARPGDIVHNAYGYVLFTGGDWEDHFLQRLPIGQPGELVITTLTKEALPMVRYRTRDRRDDDMLIIRGVNVFPSQIEAFLVDFPDLAPHYQIVLTRDGPLDAATVEVELVLDAPSDELFLAKKADEVRQHLKSTIGLTCAVDVKDLERYRAH
jgi:phenylacetate-CoA ligase